jgi:hypothetical protein
VIREFLSRYNNSNLPRADIAANVLEDELNVPRDAAREAARSCTRSRSPLLKSFGSGGGGETRGGLRAQQGTPCKPPGAKRIPGSILRARRETGATACRWRSRSLAATIRYLDGRRRVALGGRRNEIGSVASGARRFTLRAARVALERESNASPDVATFWPLSAISRQRHFPVLPLNMSNRAMPPCLQAAR